MHATAPAATAVLLLAAAGCRATAAPLDLSALPEERHAHRAEVVDGAALVLGGNTRTGERSMQRTEAFDPGAGRWLRRADMNLGRSFFSSVVVDGSVYAIGTDVERYDAERDRWEVVYDGGDLPRTHFAAAAIGSDLHIVGGYPLDRRICAVLDLTTGEVSDLPPPPGFSAGDHFHFVAALNGTLHVAGGYVSDPSGPSDQHWALVEGAWVQRAPMPSPDIAKFAAWTVADGDLFVFAMGLNARYDPESDTWSTLAAMDSLRLLPTAIAHAGRIHVLGGKVVQGRTGPLVYDVATDSW